MTYLRSALIAIVSCCALLACAVTARDVVTVDVRCDRSCDSPLLDAIRGLDAARGLRRGDGRVHGALERADLAPLARVDAHVEKLRAITGDLDLREGARGHVDLVFTSYPSADSVALKLRWLTRLAVPPAARSGLAFGAERERVRVSVDLPPAGVSALLDVLERVGLPRARR